MHQNISHNFNFYFDIVLHVADYILQCDFISQNMTISHNCDYPNMTIYLTIAALFLIADYILQCDLVSKNVTLYLTIVTVRILQWQLSFS